MFIDEESLSLLSDEDKQRFSTWESLFAHPGFSLLLESLEEKRQMAEDVILNAGSWDSYNYNRGGRDALDLVINLEKSIEHEVENIAIRHIEQSAVTAEGPLDIEINLGLVD